ncbi:hypothetical protein Tco_1264560 [Tanacetum coccineum]
MLISNSSCMIFIDGGNDSDGDDDGDDDNDDGNGNNDEELNDDNDDSNGNNDEELNDDNDDGPPTPDRMPIRASNASASLGKRIVKPSSYILSPYMNNKTKVVPKIKRLEFSIGNRVCSYAG